MHPNDAFHVDGARRSDAMHTASATPRVIVVDPPCCLTQNILFGHLEKQLVKANGDTAHWAYTKGDFIEFPCTHRRNVILHHHKSCGRIIDEHDPAPPVMQEGETLMRRS